MPHRFRDVAGPKTGAATVGAIAKPSEHERRHAGATLRDGSEIEIRPIAPEDRDRLAEGFEKLSPESRYRRFFSPVIHLGERELDYLTQIDHHDHEALVATDARSGEGIAVARFVRIEDGVAEPAIAVADAWQRRGVAGVLLDALAERAREEGIRRFVATVLSENAHAIKVFHQLGATSHVPMGHEVELTIDLTEPAEASSVLRELLRAMASGVLEPARNIWELWLRQRPPPKGFGEAIVVGIDGSEQALIAADCGRELAQTLGLPVQLVAAYRPLLDDRAAIESALREGERRLRDAGVEVTAKAGRGDPAFAILYAAMRARAGLIVLGSPSPPESGPILGSSVWNAVAHSSHCSVLIARGPRGD